MAELTITTAEVMDQLDGITGWKRDPIVRYLSHTAGGAPPIEFLTHEALHGPIGSARSAGLYTLRHRYGAAGVPTFVAALRDRSADASLVAASALAEVGSHDVSDEFFAWAKRRLARRGRLNTWVFHELPAIIQYAIRTQQLASATKLIRAHQRNLSNEEAAMLRTHCPGLLDEVGDPDHVEAHRLDVLGLLQQVNGQVGATFGTLDEKWVEYAENDFGDLLTPSSRRP